MVRSSTNVSVSQKSSVPTTAAAVVIFAVEGSDQIDGGSALSAAEKSSAQRLLAGGLVKGKAREVVVDVVETSAKKFRRLCIVGLGKSAKLTADSVRQGIAAGLKHLKSQKIRRVAVIIPTLKGVPTAAAAEAIATGALL